MIKKKNGKWLADIQPGGRGARRFRKSFNTQAEAKYWENWITRKVTENPEWMPPEKDRRKLSDLVNLWWKIHGKTLKDGENRKRWLEQICEEVNNPKAHQISPATFTAWRSERITKGNSISTVNNALAYLRALFSELIRNDEWTKENPFAKVRQIKKDETELTYLSLDNIIELLEELDRSRNPDARLVCEICLATGARWSEAEKLEWNQIKPGRIDFEKTKNGKRRSIPISNCISRKIHARERNGDRIFISCYSALREALERCRFNLPTGQSTHVLRHTFASHFMMSGGNILTLQRALGHSNLTMTMRYAHLAPDHLNEVNQFNPLAG